MEITWKIEEDGSTDGTIDPDDLLGKICLSSGPESVQDQCTYLNFWFRGLIAGYESIANDKSLQYDLICEPDPLCFEPEKNGVRISYRDSTIFIKSVQELRTALISSAQKLLQTIEDASPNKSMRPVQEIKDFLLQQS